MPAENSRAVLLDVGALTTGYGRAQVLWGIDLKVHERESIVLLGANGAARPPCSRPSSGSFRRGVDTFISPARISRGCVPISVSGEGSSTCRRVRDFPASRWRKTS